MKFTVHAMKTQHAAQASGFFDVEPRVTRLEAKDSRLGARVGLINLICSLAHSEQ